MLAATYKGPYRVKAVDKPMPEIEYPRDAIVRVTIEDHPGLRLGSGR